MKIQVYWSAHWNQWRATCYACPLGVVGKQWRVVLNWADRHAREVHPK